MLPPETVCRLAGLAQAKSGGRSIPSLGKKKLTAAFDAGQISSDGGVLLLVGADKCLGLTETWAAIIPDPAQIIHTMADILRARVLAIACGFPEADDLDDRHDDRVPRQTPRGVPKNHANAALPLATISVSTAAIGRLDPLRQSYRSVCPQRPSQRSADAE